MGVETNTNPVARYAAALTATEVGLGSVLHSSHIPFSGNLLSLNQGFILSRSVWLNASAPGVRTFPARVSAISAVLKSLSPAGKRLTPMLAIAAQGFFFSLGTVIFGANLVGVMVGMTLLCLWPFLQPLLIYYLLFGRTLFDAFHFALEQVERHVSLTESHLVTAFFVIVGLKIVLGLLVAILSRFRPTYLESSIERFLKSRRPSLPSNLFPDSSPPLKDAARGALTDLLKPLFLLSFLVTLCFFLLSHSTSARSVWILLRPFGVGFLLFFGVRMIPIRFFRPIKATLDELRASG